MPKKKWTLAAVLANPLRLNLIHTLISEGGAVSPVDFARCSTAPVSVGAYHGAVLVAAGLCRRVRSAHQGQGSNTIRLDPRKEEEITAALAAMPKKK